MRAYRVIHRVAIALLFVVAAMSIIGSLRAAPGAPLEVRLAPLVGLGVWSLVLWKIWKRPRQWGLGAGILLFLTIGLQSCLWWYAVHDPKLVHTSVPVAALSFILRDELPFLPQACAAFC